MRAVVHIDGPSTPSIDVPFLRTGFRPFFLLAAAWAALALPLWAFALAGASWAPALSVPWHGHEMLGGFAFAVIAGFLLTAVRNWTGRETVRGAPLLALAALWVGGRIAALGGASGPLVGVLDGALVLGLFVAILRPIVASRNFRNAPFLVVLALWGALEAGFHLDPARASWVLAQQLNLVVLLMVVVSGRIAPGFTQNALPEVAVVRSPRIERAALLLTATMVVAGMLGAPTSVSGIVAVLAGCAVLARARGWHATRTWRNPLLAVLHLGHAWLGIGLILRGVSILIPIVPPSLGVHALTAGAIGTLTLGMMTRVALGHTGRPLAAPRTAIAAYVCVTLAAITRLAGALAPSVLAWGLAAALFALAFVLYLVGYAPILLRPRADGLRE
jgi:uncharacterized protein involved in response to NO